MFARIKGKPDGDEPKKTKAALSGLVFCIALDLEAGGFLICDQVSYWDDETWRPLGDSNPCYRRERAVS